MTQETPDDLVVQYLAAALEMRESGLEPPLAEICGAHPELIDRVRDALAGVGQLAALDDSARDVDPLAGRLIARRYRLEKRIGAGAMGVVYRGLDVELQRPVAIKILQTSLFGGAEAEARFAREAEVLAALRHPSVITVFDRGTTDDGIMFLVMELLQGEPLSRLLEHFEELPNRGHGGDDTGWLKAALGREAQIDKSWLRQIVSWAADLAAGLHAAHRAGVLHRDVKPSNVFIDQEGRARLLDFGIASRIAHPTLANRREGGLGTPAYMAPEQIDVAREALPTLDVYGLTATLYHLITLRPPHLGTPSQVIASLQRRDPTPAYKLRRGLPRDLQAIVDCGMARDPRSRYASAADLEADLRRFLAYQPVQARAVSPVGRMWLRAKRSPTARALTATACLVICTVAYRTWREHDRRINNGVAATALAKLPQNFGLLESPADRAIGDPLERTAIATLLDEATRAEDPLPGYLYRAAFRLDHGDPRGAAADISVIAKAHRSAWSVALAEAYAKLPADCRSTLALNLESLPTPVTPIDKYLTAYHLLRRSPGANSAKAAALIDIPELAAMPAAVEMSVPPLLEEANRIDGTDPDHAQRLRQRAHAAVIQLETIQGRRTATSAYLLGNTQLGQFRYEDALLTHRDGIALCPYSAGLRIGLAIALRNTNQPQAALEELAGALALRPRHLRAHLTKIAALLDLEDFGGARASIAALPYPKDAAGENERTRQHGMLDLRIAAVMLLKGGDAVTPARRAAELLGKSSPGENDTLLAEAIAAGKWVEMAQLMLTILEHDPLNPVWLDNLAAILPKSPNTDMSDRVVQLLRDQASALRHRRGTRSPTTQSERNAPTQTATK